MRKTFDDLGEFMLRLQMEPFYLYHLLILIQREDKHWAHLSRHLIQEIQLWQLRIPCSCLAVCKNANMDTFQNARQ